MSSFIDAPPPSARRWPHQGNFMLIHSHSFSSASSSICPLNMRVFAFEHALWAQSNPNELREKAGQQVGVGRDVPTVHVSLKLHKSNKEGEDCGVWAEDADEVRIKNTGVYYEWEKKFSWLIPPDDFCGYYFWSVTFSVQVTKLIVENETTKEVKETVIFARNKTDTYCYCKYSSQLLCSLARQPAVVIL
jgi:hypothetical protein